MATTTVTQQENPMKEIRIRKVVINIGVGRSGEILENAKKVLEQLIGQKPRVRRAKKTIRDFGIHKGEPIAMMVTLRKSKVDILKRLLAAKGMKLSKQCFDKYGSCSFGIKEHIDIPNVKYDPEIGIFGMNVSVILERRGYRVMLRRRCPSKVGKKHRISREEVISYFKEHLGVEVV